MTQPPRSTQTSYAPELPLVAGLGGDGDRLGRAPLRQLDLRGGGRGAKKEDGQKQLQIENCKLQIAN